MKIQKLLIKIIVWMVIFLPFLALAQAPLVRCGTGSGMCTLCDLVTLIDRLVHYLLFYITLPVCVVALIIAGVVLMTAQGNEQKIAQGKNVFKFGILGILIAFTAWLIVNLILATLAGGWDATLPGCG